jgi:hypothetical protein
MSASASRDAPAERSAARRGSPSNTSGVNEQFDVWGVLLSKFLICHVFGE